MQEWEQSILPRLLPAKETATRCCAFLSNCGSTLLSRMLFRSDVIERGNESALAERLRRLSDEAWLLHLCSLRCWIATCRNTNTVGGEPPAEALPHEIPSVAAF